MCACCAYLCFLERCFVLTIWASILDSVFADFSTFESTITWSIFLLHACLLDIGSFFFTLLQRQYAASTAQQLTYFHEGKKNNMNMAGSQLFSVIGTPGAKEGSGRCRSNELCKGQDRRHRYKSPLSLFNHNSVYNKKTTLLKYLKYS